MDIIGRYLHLQSEEIEDKSTGKKFKKEVSYFPAIISWMLYAKLAQMQGLQVRGITI